MLGLGSAQADADHAPVAVFDRVADYLQRFFEAVHARDVGRQSDLDSVSLARLGGAVADAAEDDIAVEAAPEAERENRLQVDSAVPHGLRGVLDRDPPEVVLALERARCQHEDLDEVREVAVLVERMHGLGRIDR